MMRNMDRAGTSSRMTSMASDGELASNSFAFPGVEKHSWPCVSLRYLFVGK